MRKEAKIYVAGHRGLVGSAILADLDRKGYTNITVRTHKELDLINTNEVSNFFKSEKPEYVFLAAAKVGGIVANNTYRGEFIYDNLMIQNNVIHQSYLNNVKKLLFLGSTCIYPKNCPQPMKEEYLLTDTLEYTNEPYAIAKIAGIKMCESYNIQYGTNFIAVMPTNLYGPNDNFDLEKSHVLPALLRKIHLGKALMEEDWNAILKDLMRYPIKGILPSDTTESIIKKLDEIGITRTFDGKVTVHIWGTGAPMREFLWSEDMADACVFLMENRDFEDMYSNTTEIRNTHINIGTGVDISISDLADLIKSIVGFEGAFKFNSDKPDGTQKKLTDVSKLNALGWKHKIGLEQGIYKQYKWYLTQ
ncbi:GDP-L-fucose synthase [Flavobacteriaceae bacterium TP-CH-4]|uniref:GDP-L-fucose synthase n=1 Tax=Pelagihabitans pacificus TaxID=2696054 RepID=A0A967AVR9_9FLAO|nr:GDP-L-fucose synthase [Pelagihabitans pacificus]NHF61088.1 GDP-L-fucose synthase [Pelagihabitans pacificus]